MVACPLFPCKCGSSCAGHSPVLQRGRGRELGRVGESVAAQMDRLCRAVPLALTGAPYQAVRQAGVLVEDPAPVAIAPSYDCNGELRKGIFCSVPECGFRADLIRLLEFRRSEAETNRARDRETRDPVAIYPVFTGPPMGLTRPRPAAGDKARDKVRGAVIGGSRKVVH